MGGRGSASKLSPQLNRALNNEEDKLVQYKREHSTLFDDNGNVIFRYTSNSKNHVSFNRYQIAQMNGATLTHNHPSNGTFSDDDVNFLMTTGLKTIRAAGKNTSFELTKTNLNNQSKNFASDYRKMSNTSYNSGLAKANQYGKEYRNGLISRDDYVNKINELNNTLHTQQDTWLKNNASKYGCSYRVIKRR